jgi:hypothetical protein
VLLDDCIACRHLGVELFGRRGDGVARLDHEHDLAGLGQAVDQFLERVGADDLAALDVVATDEIIHLAGRTVVDSDGEPVVFHVQHKVLAHDGKAHNANVTFLGHRCFLVSVGVCDIDLVVG